MPQKQLSKKQCDELVDIVRRPILATSAYVHPKSIAEFESIYRAEYKQQLESCGRWTRWCEAAIPPDTHGMNFHQGMRSAHIFNNIKMEQLLRILKGEPPNV